MPSSPKRPELLLALAAVSAGLLVAEAGLRVASVATPKPTGYAPVNTATNRRAHGPVNSGGYRDLERIVTKPPGTVRVVALGDSFTWGASVEFDDAWPQRVERALNREARGHFEVVNLAMPGFKTIDEASTLLETGFAYGPDVVVVAYVLNDSEDKDAAEARRAERWLVEKRAPVSPRWLDRSALFSFVRGRLWATRENRERYDGYLSMYRDDAPGWLAAQAALKTIGGACRERGVPWIVAIFPLFGNPLDDRYPFAPVHSKVASVASAAGARVVDLLETYRGLRPDLLVVDGADDEHPNEIAHHLAARAIVKVLEDTLPTRSNSGEPN